MRSLNIGKHAADRIRHVAKINGYGLATVSTNLLFKGATRRGDVVVDCVPVPLSIFCNAVDLGQQVSVL